MLLLGMWIDHSGKVRTGLREPSILTEKLRSARKIDFFTCRILRAALEHVPERPSFRHVELMAAVFASMTLEPACSLAQGHAYVYGYR